MDETAPTAGTMLLHGELASISDLAVPDAGMSALRSLSIIIVRVSLQFGCTWNLYETCQRSSGSFKCTSHPVDCFSCVGELCAWVGRPASECVRERIQALRGGAEVRVVVGRVLNDLGRRSLVCTFLSLVVPSVCPCFVLDVPVGGHCLYAWRYIFRPGRLRFSGRCRVCNNPAPLVIMTMFEYAPQVFPSRVSVMTPCQDISLSRRHGPLSLE